MEYKIQISAFIFCAIMTTYSYAYETPTHERISEAALKNSVLFETDGVLKELGIVIPIDIKDFKEEEGVPVEGNQRFHDFYLDRNLENQRNVIGHVRLGSNYEDMEEKWWACSHFFDPVNDKQLKPILCPSQYNFRSPSWALYGVDANGSSMAERDDALIRDGVSRFFLALTSEEKTTREEYFGALFRTLGQAIHHLQDMTQPQHSRDDAHLPWSTGASLYEQYSNCKYKVDKPTQIPKWYVRLFSDYVGEKIGNCAAHGAPEPDRPLPQEDYSELSLNQFNHARKFWQNAGQGIAEFSNANFVSQNTNFRISNWDPSVPINTLTYTYRKYPLPDPNNDGGPIISSSRIEAPIPDGLGSGPDQPLRGEIRFFGTMVKDEYTGTSTPNPRTSSLSLFSSDLENYNFLPTGSRQDPGNSTVLRLFSLNRFTFDAAHDYLLPRAVSYSTGLINYFFRGRVVISNVLHIGNRITITVKNVTADKNSDNAAFSFSDGYFYLYYDDADGNRTSIAPVNWNGDVWLTGSELLENEDELSMVFKVPYTDGLIDIDFKKPLTLFFDGKIGHADMERSKWESGIAATTFYAEPLLSFDISRSDGNAPVANIIDINASYDLGLNWSPVSEFAISVAFGDATLDPFNRLGINAVTYIGNRELLVYPDYLDYYYDDTLGVVGLSIGALRLSAYGAQNILPGIPLDWPTALDGAGNNFSDWMATLRSLSATGPTSLAVLRISKPPFTDPPPRVRTYELLSLPDWRLLDNSWVMSGNPDAGGLPELSWLGGDDFIMATQVEASETGNPDARERDSALRKTSDGGLNYTELARMAVCEAADDFCIQHIVPLDEGRLFGWIEQHAGDYPGNTKFYTSPDGGTSWTVLGESPGMPECSPSPLRYTEVNSVIYLGSSRPEVDVVNDVLFIETTCKEIIEDNGVYSSFNITSTNVFASQDSGTNWVEVTKPPRLNGRIIFAGDNGVVPGAFDP